MTYSQNQNCYFSCDLRLTFGIPLEDVFPEGNVHPSLKRLFDTTYYYYLKENQAIQCLTTKEPPELIPIINSLTFNRPLPSMMSFAVLISTIKHYFKALPVPLIPKYTNKTHFNWLQLSAECRTIIQNRFMHSRDGLFIETLATELLRLPRVNLLLISYFVNFLRSLVYFGKSRQRYNRRSANILINYFCTSIFTRISNDESNEAYRPLMLFMIVKWPHIQRKCIDKQPFCFHQTESTQIYKSLTLKMQTKVDTEILPTTNLSTIDENSEQIVMICDQATSMNCSQSVCTQTSKEQQLFDEILKELTKCYQDTKASQTSAAESKKTSTISLLAYTQNRDVLKSESLPPSSGDKASIGSIAEEKPSSKVSSCFKLNEERLEKFQENLETMETLPNATNSTNTELDYTTNSKEPLTKQRKSLLNMAKQFPAISLIRQIKDLKLCGRARSEEFMKGSVKYQKLGPSSTF